MSFILIIEFIHVGRHSVVLMIPHVVHLVVHLVVVHHWHLIVVVVHLHMHLHVHIHWIHILHILHLLVVHHFETSC